MKKIISYIFVFFVLLFAHEAVLAKSLTAGLEVSEKNITRGDEVEVTVKIKNGVEEDMNVFQTIVSFDESLFEGIDETSFKTHNGWFEPVYNKDTHALILINKFGSRLSEDVVTFKLKVRDKVKPKTTSITLKNMVVASKDEEQNVNDVSTKVNLSVPAGELSGIGDTKEYYGKTLEGSVVKSYNILVIIILELIIATVLVMLYYASKLYVKDTKHRRLIAGGLCVVEVFAIAAMFGYDVDRGELSGDGKIDFKDVQIMREHLVNLNMISPLKLVNADLNKDGKITTRDLSILLDKTMSKSEYKVVLTDSLMESNGYEKGSIVDIKFTADISDDVNIEYVLIDGKKYKVQKNENNPKEYTVKMEASKESKKYNYNFTEVILETGKSIKVDYKTQVMVLKDIPKITSFATNYNKEESKVNIAMTLEDHDNAIVDAKYELVSSNGIVVKSGSIEKGKNTFTFALENAKSYKFKIKANYNRGADSGEYLGVISDSYDIKIVTDYRLQVGALALVQNGSQVANLQKGTDTVLTFNSTNVTGYVPRKAMVNGKLYSVVSLGGNKYGVNLPNDLIRSGNNLSLSKIILSNGKVLLTNEKISYNLLKDVPSVIDLSGIEDIINNKMALNVSIKDEDKALSKIVIRLYDGNNELLSESSIDDDNYHVMLDTLKDTDKYTVRIYGDYSTLDGNAEYQFNEVLLIEKRIDALQKVYVKSIIADKIYPEKNEVIKLAYNISSNYNSNVSKIIVDNVIYDVKKSELDTYEIEVPAGVNAGIKEIRTSKIIYENGFEYNLDEVINVDVLKDKPIVDNFEIVENIEESKIDVSFDLFDKDGAFISGSLKLIEKETGEIKREEDVIFRKNATKFILENDVKYNVQIVINAVLDTKTLSEDSPNILKDYEIKKVEARLITDYKLDITNIDTYSLGEESPKENFHKYEKIEVAFTSSNATEYFPIKVKIGGKSYDVLTVDGVSKFTFDGFAEEGLQNIKFESIVLSNHVDLAINASKRVEIMKDEPVVSSFDVSEEDNSIKLQFEVEDNDDVLSALKVIVLDENSAEILNQSILKEDGKATFEKRDKRKFTIKLSGDYNLKTSAGEQTEFEYRNKILFEKLIDLDGDYADIQNITDVSLIYDITLEDVLNVTLEDLADLELYRANAFGPYGTSKVYEIEKIKRIENTIFFVLKNEDWIKYNQKKWSNKLIYEYGSVDELGFVHKRHN